MTSSTEPVVHTPQSRVRPDLRWPLVGLLLVAVGTVLTVVALTGIAAVLLLGTWAAGIGLTYAARIDLRVEERLAWGAPVGALAVGVVLLLLGLLAGHLTGPLVLLALAVPLAAGLVLAWPSRRRLRRELTLAAARWRRGEPWPLWLLLFACWPYVLALLGRSYRVTAQGIVSGNEAAYADWSAHLTYISSFAFADNFPPSFPVDAGHAMTYTFLVDLWAAGAVVLGSPATSAITVTSGMLALALPPAIYLAWLRLAGQRTAALLAVAVFLLSGGFGFVLFLQQLAQHGTRILGALPEFYTQDPTHNLQWLNPVLAWIVPQRDVLLGFALVPVALALLSTARGKSGAGPFLAVGVLAGLLPLGNVVAYGTLVCLGVWWALLDNRRIWWRFLTPALGLGLPQTIWLLQGGAAGSLRLQLGWMSSADGAHQSDVVFWLLNTGILVPLMLLAFCWRGTLRPALWWRLVPIWLWFLVPNVVVFQPWDWDNTKFFAYWLLIGSLPVGLVLTRIWRLVPAPSKMRPAVRALTVVLMITLGFAGALDLARSLESGVGTAAFVDAGGVKAAGWVRANTPPHAVFLVAPDNNEAIPVLAGRTLVSGYSGWNWTYGLSDWAQRQEQADSMLAGAPGTPQLVRQYRVEYVVIGPQEIGARASLAYWGAHGRLVYDRDGYQIFRVTGG